MHARRVSSRLLAQAGSLAAVAATATPILRAQGLSDAAVSDIARARSLASAMARDLASQGPVLSSWSALVDYLRVALAHLPREEFGLFVVDRLFDRAELRLGDRRPQVVRIRRLGAGL